MTRGLSGAAAAAVQAEVVRRTCAVELDFGSGFVRLNGSPADITIGGELYTGVGMLGGISGVEESGELRSYGLTLTLSGVPRDAVAIALGEHYQGRPGTVYEVLFDDDWQVITDPIVMFRGRMDQMPIKLGAEAQVSVTLTNRLADWDRPRLRRYTDEDQQRQFPGDLGFQFVSATAAKEIVWPAKGFSGSSSNANIAGGGISQWAQSGGG